MQKIFDAVQHPRAALLLLRWTLAILLLLHGVSKLMNGIAPIAANISGLGLPGFLAYAVYLGEVVAPLLLLAGIWVVPAALVVAVNMLVAVGLVHMGHLTEVTKNGGWALELQAFYFVSALVVAMTAKVAGGRS